MEVLVHSILLIESDKVISVSQNSHHFEKEIGNDEPHHKYVQASSVLGIVLAFKTI